MNRAPSRAAVLGAFVGSILAPGCGERAPSPAPVPAPALPIDRPRGEREVIPASSLAEIAASRLERRDEPLGVGATAPRFAGLPGTGSTVLVFLRGEW